MRIYPAVHYTMGGCGGLQLDEHLPGRYNREANFSDQARTGWASALMQGLAEGYFILPYTLADYLRPPNKPNVPSNPEFKKLSRRASRTKSFVDQRSDRDIVYRELGK